MKAESGPFHCLSADKVDPMHEKVLPKCGKGSETCRGYWNLVEGYQKGWGAPETVTDMWNVQKRVKIYQKHKQQQCCTLVTLIFPACPLQPLGI